MTPERVAALVGRWVRFYVRELPRAVASRRVEELDADLHDQIEHGRAIGLSDRRIAMSIGSRMVRGLPADVAWRDEQSRATGDQPGNQGGPMNTYRTSYLMAATVALGSVLLLAFGVLAMGVIGAEGDPFDLLYIAVLAFGIIGALIARFEPTGMVRVLIAMAAAQAVIAVIALLVGKHEVPVSSVAEILGLNAFFAALFAGSAWLFQRAARRQSVS